MGTGVLVCGLLIALLGFIWVLVLDILEDTHHSHDKRQERASPEQRHGYKPHDAHPGSQRFRSDNET